MKLQLRIVCSAVLAGIICCSPTDAVATEDGRIFGASIEVSQVTEAVQTDASRPEVDFSRIGIVTDLIHDDPEFDPQVNPIAEIELPAHQLLPELQQFLAEWTDPDSYIFNHINTQVQQLLVVVSPWVEQFRKTM